MSVPPGGRARRWLATLVVFGLAFAFHAWLEFRVEGLLEVDGYYHVRVATLYGNGELPVLGGSFPWMAYASFGRLFGDWQLGYHLLLVPFTACGALLGGKLSAAFFAALLVATVHAILRAQRVPLAWLFALSLCFASEMHLLRSHLVRPTTLAVTLLLVVAHCAATRRTLGLFLSTLALLLVYAVPHNALAVLAVALLAHAALEGRVPRKLPLALLAGGVLAVLLHPGFWHWEGSFLGADHALFRVWRQMDGSLQAANEGNQVVLADERIPLPAPGEFRAPNGKEILADFLAPLALFLATLAALGLPARRRADPFLFVFTGLAVLYFLLFLAHERFFEYWIPFTVVALGAALGRALGDEPRATLRALRERPWAQRAAAGLLALGLAGVVGRQGWLAVRGALATIDSGKTGNGLEYADAMRWLEEHTEQGELVFHDRWPSFSPMFYFNQRDRYLIGLDPYFFFQLDPERYRRWILASDGRFDPADTKRAVVELGARYAFTRKNSAFAARLRQARGVTPAFEDRRFVVFRVGPE